MSSTTAVSAPNYGYIQGELISLRDVQDCDLSEIYRISFNSQTQHLWAPNLPLVSFEKFADRLMRRIHHRWDHFKVIVRRKDQCILGFSYCYNIAYANMTSNICICIDKAYMNTSQCLQSAYLYLSHLFIDLKYRKLYCEVFAYNYQCLSILKKLDFIQEGRLSEHQFWSEQYWDMFIYSLNRRQFSECCRTRSRLIKKLSCHQLKN
ncbi:GNAT family N-acetyltransferase [Pelagibaculum spongiae]|uniref:N-acetyltransferase domain-containing protein n=1 Tax=Pelagibaculum spongiae TaxID=2080658 RepID=A0A2V1GXY7_9GAMM|nr:GNAT family protein [Pelagibaculum spongiae]PVZ66755.1 hypothetical protein DC094_15940 [Pelagibaculum spongiae]